ncbi:MAG TPA: NTPase [Sedimentisphaerales bacterium]|nr:NTPase [Sedimentisphaerales bacterium]
MSSESAKVLLTGLPGCGKTTAIVQIAATLNRLKAAGFYTQEIREGNNRKGFRWTRLDGATGILAHVDIKVRFKVGKYGVDIAGFEESVVPILDIERSDVELFVIDEIGKMECFSEKFVAAVRGLFASDRAVLAAVARKGAGFISEVKNYPGIRLFTLTRRNRDKTVAEILEILSSRKVPPTQPGL